MKTLTLKQVFDSISYTPAPLPASDLNVMDIRQARTIITCFAADDAAFFNFIHSLKPSPYLPTPLQSGIAMEHFGRYAKVTHPRMEIPLSSDRQLKITPEDTSGQVKAKDFMDLLKTALQCRKDVAAASSLTSPEVIRTLEDFSKAVNITRDRGLTLSSLQFDQIKNLALPTNPADPALADRNYMDQIYSMRFQSEIKGSRGGYPLRNSSRVKH